MVDFPHSTRAKKFFLVLMVGGAAAVPQPRGLDGGEPEDEEEEVTEVAVAQRRSRKKARRGQGREGVGTKKGRDWILKKKGQQRARGVLGVKPDSKYTGRKRKDRF